MCIPVDFPSIDCPIDFSFTVLLSTRDGTAGKCLHLSATSVTDSILSSSLTEYTSDYRRISKLITFPRCGRVHCETLYFFDDQILEETETFNIDVNRTTLLDPRIMLGPVTATMTIIDNDGKSLVIATVVMVLQFLTVCINCPLVVAVVGLQRTAIRVAERASSVNVCVIVRSPRTRCPVMFSFHLLLMTESQSASMSIRKILLILF